MATPSRGGRSNAADLLAPAWSSSCTTTGMMVFRSLVLGLLGACAILLAQAANRPVVVQAAAPANRATIIDVAPGVGDVIPLIGLAPGEHVLAVGDRTVRTDLEAGAAIRDTRQSAGHYVDLTTTQRRVLVLLH